MKRIFFFAFLMTIVLITGIFIGCKKSVTTKPKTLIANAGPDSVINMPNGNPWDFVAILNGKSSYSTIGHITSYSWTAIDHYDSTSINSPNTDSTVVTFSSPSTGVSRFRLEVRDNLGNFDYDTVSITINRKFQDEYDGIPWDSTINSLTYIELNGHLSNDGTWPVAAAFDPYLTPDLISLCSFNGNCNDINGWEIIPYVTRDSIKLTDKNIFYSTDSSACCVGVWFIIYATPNAGIDFSQKLSVGFSRFH
jgi:hypothetical protein